MKASPAMVLLVADVMLGVILASMLAGGAGGRWPAPAAVAPALERPDVPEMAGAGGSEALTQTTQRPLFVPSRRPSAAKPPAPATAASAEPAQDLRLLGLYGSGPTGGAIIQQGDKARRVRVGEQVGGWMLASSQGRTATLVHGSEKRRLSMGLVPANAASRPATAPTRSDAPANPTSVPDDTVEDR